MNIKRLFLFGSALLIFACNKNSLQLPENRFDNVSIKMVKHQGIDKIELIITQDKDDPEGKANIKIKNVSGAVMNDVKILLDYCPNDTVGVYYNHCNNQVILSFDTLYTAKEQEYRLPFYMPNFKIKQLHAELLETSNFKQINSGNYSFGSVIFEKQNEIPLSSSPLTGFITADGSLLVKMMKGSTYYHIRGSFSDTSYFLNGALYKNGTQQIANLTIDTLIEPAQFYTLTNKMFQFRLLLDTIQTDSTSSLLIKLQKNL